MAVKKDYSKARAKKSKSTNINAPDIDISKSDAKKVANKVKKSPILVVVLIALVIGVAAGYFAFDFLSGFEMLAYSVNGVESVETDYVVIDMSVIKEEYLKTDADATMDEIFASVTLSDNGAECKFFGFDVSPSINTKYYYREDISHDVSEVEKIDIQTAGVYYIEYTTSHFAFKSQTLIRTIIVTEVENDG